MSKNNQKPDIEIIVTDADGKERKIDSNSILPVEQILPNKLNIIAIQGRPIFPGVFTPLMVSSAEDVKVVEAAYEGDGFLGIIMAKKDSDNSTIADLHEVKDERLDQIE